MVNVRGRTGAALGLLVMAVGFGLVAAGPSVLVMSLGALITLGLVPGVLLASILFARADDLDWIEFGAISVGLGIVAMVLGTYGLHIVPGPLTQRMMLSFYAGVDLVLLAVVFLMGRVPSLSRPSWSRKQTIAFVAIIFVACLLRLTMVGYSEFQGDEGRAALRAAEVLQGYDEVLLLHKKGPVEIILPAALYAATQRLTETTARLPLAIANVAFLVSLTYLGRRLVSPWVGLVAAGILTVDGFLIGFSRLLQYQSVILLTTTLVLLALSRATENERLDRGMVWAAALLAATALLAHYEGIFVLPAALWMVWRWLRRNDWSVWQALGAVALPVIAGAALVGLFYIPFVLHPNFAATSEYLTERRVGGGIFYSNLADYFQRAGFYSSTYYVLALAGVLGTGCGVFLWRHYGGTRWRWLVLALLPLWILALGWPLLWNVGGVNLTVMLFAATVALAWFASKDDNLRTLVVWFGVPALFYFFMMTKVHTHYYGTLPGWTLLVGSIAVSAWRQADASRWVRPALVSGGFVWWALCLGYVGVAFMRTWPEWMSDFSVAKPAIYWAPFEQPHGGYFGFPYRTAWKAIGSLYADGTLSGSYDSNQEDLVTNWYTRGELRVQDSDLFIVTRDLENMTKVPPGMIDGSYGPMIELTRRGKGQLWVFCEGYDGPMRQIAAEELDGVFDEELSAPIFKIGAPLDDPFDPALAVNARMGDVAELVGWTLEADMARPGDTVLMTLYWRALFATDAGYNVFASLGDNDPVANLEGVPQGGENPTYRWEPGEEIVDRHLLAIDAEAPEGVYPLRLGMIDYLERTRLLVYDAGGGELGSTLYLGDIRVGVPELVEAFPDAQTSAMLGDSVMVSPVPDVDGEAEPGDAIEFDVTWYARQAIEQGLTVFVQCLGPDGIPYGQVDTVPKRGTLPTNFWQTHERIDDHYSVMLSDDAPAGRYRVVMGLYDPATGVREPVVLHGQPQPDGMLVIGHLEVSE